MPPSRPLAGNLSLRKPPCAARGQKITTCGTVHTPLPVTPPAGIIPCFDAVPANSDLQCAAVCECSARRDRPFSVSLSYRDEEGNEASSCLAARVRHGANNGADDSWPLIDAVRPGRNEVPGVVIHPGLAIDFANALKPRSERVAVSDAAQQADIPTGPAQAPSQSAERRLSLSQACQRQRADRSHLQ